MIYVEYAYTDTPGRSHTRLCNTLKEAEAIRDALDFQMKRSNRYAYVRIVMDHNSSAALRGELYERSNDADGEA